MLWNSSTWPMLHCLWLIMSASIKSPFCDCSMARKANPPQAISYIKCADGFPGQAFISRSPQITSRLSINLDLISALIRFVIQTLADIHRHQLSQNLIKPSMSPIKVYYPPSTNLKVGFLPRHNVLRQMPTRMGHRRMPRHRSLLRPMPHRLQGVRCAQAARENLHELPENPLRPLPWPSGLV